MIEIPEELEKAYREYRVRYIAQQLLRIPETETDLIRLTDEESLRVAESLEESVNVELLKDWNDPDYSNRFLAFSQFMALVLALKDEAAERRKDSESD